MQEDGATQEPRADPWRELATAAEKIAHQVADNFESAWPQMPTDLFEPGPEEVLTGLMARQVRLFWLICDDVHFWQPDLGSIGLRALTDGLINMRLIASGGAEAAVRFREHSMGNLKLHKLHIEKLIDSGALPADWEDRVTDLQTMIDLHKWEEIIEIDLGNWNDQTARDNALTTGLKAEYDLYYAAGSAHVHAEWSGLLETVLEPCREPLHRFHQIPRPPMLIPSHPRFLIDAFSLVRESFRTWSEATRAPLPHFEPAASEFQAAAAALISLFASRRRSSSSAPRETPE